MFFFFLVKYLIFFFFFFSSRRRHTRFSRDWSSDVCSSDLGGMCSHPAAALDLLGVDATRSFRGRVGLHAVERPRQVDGRWSRLEQDAGCLLEVLAVPHSERVAVGGRDADRRGTAHSQVPDCGGHVGGRATFELDLLVGQSPLVEDNDAVVLEPDDPLRLEHARQSRGRCLLSAGWRRGYGSSPCEADSSMCVW